MATVPADRYGTKYGFGSSQNSTYRVRLQQQFVFLCFLVFFVSGVDIVTQYSQAALDTRIAIAQHLLSQHDRYDSQSTENERHLIYRLLDEKTDVSQYDQHLIETELALSSALLAEQEAVLEEVQLIVEQLRAKMRLLSGLLEKQRTFKQIPTNICDQHRSPMEMLRSPYKGMKLSDIIEHVLNQSRAPLTPKDITRLIYDTFSPEEFDRARSSLAAEMRGGAKSKNPRWRKLGRSAYVALSAPVPAMR